MKVAVVGAGIGGPAAALFLQRQGHTVTLFERVADPGPVGAGILLQPIGQQVLQQLNLLEAIKQRAAIVPRLYGQTIHGRPVLDFRYDMLGSDVYGLGVHRGVVFNALWGALSAAGVAVQTGVEIKNIQQRTLITGNDETYGAYDLIVIADGARSQLRTTLDIPISNNPYPFGALWFIAEDPEQRLENGLMQTFDGTQKMFGLMSTGLGPAPGTTPLISMFWSIDANQVEHLYAAGLAVWKDSVRAMRNDLDFILEQITDLEQLTFANYYDVVMPRWHQDNIVVIGDAGHAMSPQLGMGANIALVDAAVLSNCIAQNSNVQEALAIYSKQRKPHLRFYQFASRWLTPIFQSNYKWIGPPRDIVFPIGGKLPFFKQQMMGTLAGRKAGIFRKITL